MKKTLPEGPPKQIYVETKNLRMMKKDKTPRAMFLVHCDGSEYLATFIEIKGPSTSKTDPDGLFHIGAPNAYIETTSEVVLDRWELFQR